jgi:hypothetical protein
MFAATPFHKCRRLIAQFSPQKTANPPKGTDMSRTYTCDLPTASPDPHEGCEARVAYLAQAAAELADFYEGVLFTLKRQRNDAQAELRAKTEQLSALQVTP